MFAVQVRIENRNGLLKPGMNADVEVHIGSATACSRCRTPRCGSARRGQRGHGARDRRGTAEDSPGRGRETPRFDADHARRANAAERHGQGDDTGAREPGARSHHDYTGWPPSSAARGRDRGGSAEPDAEAAPAGQLTAAENATCRKVMQAFRAGGGGRGFGGGGWNGPPPGWSRGNRLPVRGNYIVFVRQNGEPTPVYIRTGSPTSTTARW